MATSMSVLVVVSCASHKLLALVYKVRTLAIGYCFVFIDMHPSHNTVDCLHRLVDVGCVP